MSLSIVLSGKMTTDQGALKLDESLVAFPPGNDDYVIVKTTSSAQCVVAFRKDGQYGSRTITEGPAFEAYQLFRGALAEKSDDTLDYLNKFLKLDGLEYANAIQVDGTSEAFYLRLLGRRLKLIPLSNPKVAGLQRWGVFNKFMALESVRTVALAIVGARAKSEIIYSYNGCPGGAMMQSAEYGKADVTSPVISHSDEAPEIKVEGEKKAFNAGGRVICSVMTNLANLVAVFAMAGLKVPASDPILVDSGAGSHPCFSAIYPDGQMFAVEFDKKAWKEAIAEFDAEGADITAVYRKVTELLVSGGIPYTAATFHKGDATPEGHYVAEMCAYLDNPMLVVKAREAAAAAERVAAAAGAAAVARQG